MPLLIPAQALSNTLALTVLLTTTVTLASTKDVSGVNLENAETNPTLLDVSFNTLVTLTAPTSRPVDCVTKLQDVDGVKIANNVSTLTELLASLLTLALTRNVDSMVEHSLVECF
jgi:hypothetical protein